MYCLYKVVLECYFWKCSGGTETSVKTENQTLCTPDYVTGALGVGDQQKQKCETWFSLD